MKEYEYHPLSNLFLLMEGEEFDRLVDDIEKNGLLEPIVLFENKILDGRNRYRACIKLGIQPVFKKFPNRVKPLQYVIAENVRRRHLDALQLSLISLELEKELIREEERNRKENWEKALEKYKEKKEKYLRLKKLKRRNVHPPKEPKEPEPINKTTIRKKVSEDLKVSTVSIRKTEKILEKAKTKPEIKQALQNALKRDESLYKLETEIDMIEFKERLEDKNLSHRVIDIDKDQIEIMEDIWLKITREYRYNNIKEYGRETQKKCIEIMNKAYKFIFNEVQKYGKENTN